jgi:hypothetical protein
MSEYQYYEFRAIDRPLTAREMAQLRALSTRAEITSNSFINEYHYGDFKGDPRKLMEKYFDAFLYMANWGTHWLMLRLPAGLLDLEAAKPYGAGEGLDIQRKGEYVILDFQSENEEGEGWLEVDDELDRLLPIRAELMAGDLRALYLGWLAMALSGELGEDDLEPPAPPGLRKLSRPLKALAEFLRIDSGLLATAAEFDSGSPPSGPARAELAAWLTALTARERDQILLDLVEDETPLARAEVLRRFREVWAKSRPPSTAATPPRRTVGQLLRAGEETAERQEREQEERKRRAHEAARKKRLDALAARASDAWKEVETLVSAKVAKSYDRAVELLRDLRDLAVREGRGKEAAQKIADLRQRHATKRSFLDRLKRAGLL